MSGATSVRLDIGRLRGLFGGVLGECVCILATARIAHDLDVIHGGPEPVRVIVTAEHEPVDALHNRIPDQACSLIVLTESEFVHMPPASIRRAKVAAVSFFTEPYQAAALQDTLDVVADHDFAHEKCAEVALLDGLDRAQRVLMVTQDTRAVWNHRSAAHWFSLAGPLDFGHQTVLPTGEVSALSGPSGEMGLPFALEGELLLDAIPIVHRGDASVSQQECQALYKALASLREQPTRVTVEGGALVALHGDGPGRIALERLISQGENHALVHEIGFGLNRDCRRLLAGNQQRNERYPGLHIGLGLGTHSSYHVDLVLPRTRVLLDIGGQFVDFYEKEFAI